jgi:hypothetical protein
MLGAPQPRIVPEVAEPGVQQRAHGRVVDGVVRGGGLRALLGLRGRWLQLHKKLLAQFIAFVCLVRRQQAGEQALAGVHL